MTIESAQMKTLTTSRLRLRHVREDDFPFIARLMNEKGYLDYVGDRGVRTERDAARYVATAALYRYENSLGFNLVESRADATPLGICGLVMRGEPGVVEIGYGFLDQAAGSGFATEAAAITVAHAFDDLRVDCLHAITHVRNAASRRVLEKLGMMLTGTGADQRCTYRMRPEDRRPGIVPGGSSSRAHADVERGSE